MDQISVMGQQLFHYVQVAGYWVTLVAGGSQVLGCISKRDAEGAFRAAFTYGAAFSAIWILKFILDLIQKVFVV